MQDERLRAAAKKFKQDKTAENLKAVQHEAVLLQATYPEKAQEVAELLKTLLPLSTLPPPSASPTTS